MARLGVVLLSLVTVRQCFWVVLAAEGPEKRTAADNLQFEDSLGPANPHLYCESFLQYMNERTRPRRRSDGSGRFPSGQLDSPPASPLHSKFLTATSGTVPLPSLPNQESQDLVGAGNFPNEGHDDPTADDDPLFQEVLSSLQRRTKSSFPVSPERSAKKSGTSGEGSKTLSSNPSPPRSTPSASNGSISSSSASKQSESGDMQRMPSDCIQATSERHQAWQSVPSGNRSSGAGHAVPRPMLIGLPLAEGSGPIGNDSWDRVGATATVNGEPLDFFGKKFDEELALLLNRKAPQSTTDNEEGLEESGRDSKEDSGHDGQLLRSLDEVMTEHNDFTVLDGPISIATGKDAPDPDCLKFFVEKRALEKSLVNHGSGYYLNEGNTELYEPTREIRHSLRLLAIHSLGPCFRVEQKGQGYDVLPIFLTNGLFIYFYRKAAAPSAKARPGEWLPVLQISSTTLHPPFVDVAETFAKQHFSTADSSSSTSTMLSSKSPSTESSIELELARRTAGSPWIERALLELSTLENKGMSVLVQLETVDDWMKVSNVIGWRDRSKSPLSLKMTTQGRTREVLEGFRVWSLPLSAYREKQIRPARSNDLMTRSMNFVTDYTLRMLSTKITHGKSLGDLDGLYGVGRFLQHAFLLRVKPDSAWQWRFAHLKSIFGDALFSWLQTAHPVWHQELEDLREEVERYRKAVASGQEVANLPGELALGRLVLRLCTAMELGGEAADPARHSFRASVELHKISLDPAGMTRDACYAVFYQIPAQL